MTARGVANFGRGDTVARDTVRPEDRTAGRVGDCGIQTEVASARMVRAARKRFDGTIFG